MNKLCQFCQFAATKTASGCYFGCKRQNVSQPKRCFSKLEHFLASRCTIFKVQVWRNCDCISFLVVICKHRTAHVSPTRTPQASVCFPCGLFPFCPSTPTFFFPPDLKCLTRLPCSRSTLSPSSDSHPADFPQVMLHSIGFFHFKCVIWLFFLHYFLLSRGKQEELTWKSFTAVASN